MQYLKFYKDLVPGDFSLKGCLHGDFPQLYILICPGESQGRQGLVGCRLWGLTESDTTEAT